MSFTVWHWDIILKIKAKNKKLKLLKKCKTFSLTKFTTSRWLESQRLSIPLFPSEDFQVCTRSTTIFQILSREPFLCHPVQDQLHGSPVSPLKKILLLDLRLCCWCLEFLVIFLNSGPSFLLCTRSWKLFIPSCPWPSTSWSQYQCACNSCLVWILAHQLWFTTMKFGKRTSYLCSTLFLGPRVASSFFFNWNRVGSQCRVN